MIKNYFFILFFFVFSPSFSQIIVINELDCDTPSIDTQEFVELKSATPNFSLNGYVLVFFNGNAESVSTGNRSYLTVSLDGITTDANGIAVIGSNGVSPVPNRIFGDNLIQNGPDAVAVYLGTYLDFPDGTLATTTNLIHALAYGTSDPDATQLMNLLGVTTQWDESVNGQVTTQSIQRKNDGTYETKTPTPGAPNDGSGVVYNGITISTSATQINEGDSFTITFTTQNAVTSPLNFDFTLNNETFNTADFTGATNVSIGTGSNEYTTTIQVIDDAEDEGDELIKITFGTLPEGYVRMNDNVEIRVIDNDFTTSPWGTPLNPTYGNVTPTIPDGYYASLNGKSGTILKQAVQDIIANPAVVRAHTYGDVTEILKKADQNPQNSNEVWLMYKEINRAKFLFQDSGSGTGKWNREHIFPQSRGGFSNATSDQSDGIDIFENSNANIRQHGHSDAHHLRAEDAIENSTRNNKDFGPLDYNGFAGNAGSWKGDVARALFFMAVRYNGLELVEGNPSDNTANQIGDLAILLQWNQTDPADDFEMNRNNYIQTWQMNRNPFIDMPELANYIWGENAGQTFFLSNDVKDVLKFTVYPNPAQDKITITGINSEAKIEIFSISGQKLFNSEFNGETTFNLNLAKGVYFAKISANNQYSVKKIVIE
ncbi:T9SS type A sorting domain-containing protein [Flavobacterium sp. NST-5]|uniref:T9SS type A sorting domain-containing protein n=1 Tax=Flavobacterium ichthyis TaxID=2698827 RepID=A0ABW9ZA10_9FLAO|nr:endonuclease [Flavobacterium ichthyis]NBL65717.1 T9SS type A sorting domain-containing protein [Flavobacterium ichthyis]